MDLQLKGKRALVTGSSSGVGEGIAKVLGAEGAWVVVHGRDAARTEQVARAIEQAGGRAWAVLGDLTQPADCQAVFDAAQQHLGGIDILVNNAGGRAASNRPGPDGRELNPSWLDTPWDDWLWTYEQNVGSSVRLIQRVVPGMKAQGFGRIINITSVSAAQTEPDLADYQPAKAAVTNLTSGLAKSLAGTGITVNSVAPGIIATPGVIRLFNDIARSMGWPTDDWAEVERRIIEGVFPSVIKHFGKPEDIGRMVAFLASPLSAYMTGSNYRVDGGQSRSIN